jgi:hypothetical protein
MCIDEFQSAFNTKINTIQAACERFLGGKPPSLFLLLIYGYTNEKEMML